MSLETENEALREALRECAEGADADLAVIHLAQALIVTHNMNAVRLRTAVGLLESLVKYATEDRASTPGSTRLARVVAAAGNFLDDLELSRD